jgi:hypothetical protein
VQSDPECVDSLTQITGGQVALEGVRARKGVLLMTTIRL